MNQSMEQEELIKACKRGERPAQKQLYEQYAPVMLGICYRYTTSLQEAEDVLQDAFVRVFNKLDQFRGRGSGCMDQADCCQLCLEQPEKKTPENIILGRPT